jgi:hypothetical protein
LSLQKAPCRLCMRGGTPADGGLAHPALGYGRPSEAGDRWAITIPYFASYFAKKSSFGRLSTMMKMSDSWQAWARLSTNLEKHGWMSLNIVWDADISGHT